MPELSPPGHPVSLAAPSAAPAPSPHNLAYLDGLRGLAACQVVAHHYLVAFYPALLTADPYVSHLGGAEVVIAGSPLNVLYSGNFAVCLFFVLSGLVLSEQFFRTRAVTVLHSYAARRYVRLLVPIAFSVLLAVVIWVAGGFQNQAVAALTRASWLGQVWHDQPLVPAEVPADLAFDILLSGEARYNPVLWTMSLELYGSLLVFGLLAVVAPSRYRFWLYGVLTVGLAASELSLFYLAFVAGVVLNDARHSGPGWLAGFRHGAWPLAVLLVGLLLGSYPTADFVDVDQSLYRLLSPAWLAHETVILLTHMAGAALVIAGVLGSGGLQRVLSSRPLRWLGAISFSLYLLHFLVLGSLSSALFLALQPRLGYHAAFGVMLLASGPVLLAAAYAMYRLVDLPGMRLSKWLYARFLQPELTRPPR
ncbi:acyltransferase [Hymenobacter sp. BT175]|uniref:acyltransferase family protein n=1 Tax=Hymenobacter translucens TaxID=2886507 RepID=UPI001D0E35A4|nr:acyltransferase [Hymenobacter translucens]MCC2546648.1 acyltransferase [Hymenobacter translucens]